MARRFSLICLLLLTLLFLLCEIIIGQICRSILIAVDSFHTLYLFINMALYALKHHRLHRPNLPSSPDSLRLSQASVQQDFRRVRLEPFGVLISTLFMASQCVSISLEILTHLVQPEAVQHPPLVIMIGGLSLIVNLLVLIWRSQEMDGDDSGMQNKQESSLMFCNPEAPCVKDQGREKTRTDPEVKHRHTSHQCVRDTSQEETQAQVKLPGEQKSTGCVPGGLVLRGRQLSFFTLLQDLLTSILVFSNGLVLLLSRAHCHRPHADCHFLVHLDTLFSTMCVLVLLSSALPKLHRYGLLLLQATPLHLSVAKIRVSLSEIKGVLSVHELHVWQLSEDFMVASLHVHCPDCMSAKECKELMKRIRDVLSNFGIKHCTIQPEFLSSDRNATESFDAVHDVSSQPFCSLRCGKECVEKLCCSPNVNESQFSKAHGHSHVPKKTSAAVEVEETEDVIFENTYL
ncbi:hypothetical protein DNTS_003563 [Danionella cerebrum]|uniref:Cation efflux protein cytoplasmic domain-containing protein n=1 Tax=Danionella cerebrum TaxID=2873325 RepID=A0A553PZI0_9TELE|nr:hypothetical protein DNTS_003563 [Danionella translucida]